MKKNTVADTFNDCIRSLEALKTSGYWPFASPAPCSTELKIKKAVEAAIGQLEIARANHEAMFGRTGRDPMKVASMAIVKK